MLSSWFGHHGRLLWSMIAIVLWQQERLQTTCSAPDIGERQFLHLHPRQHAAPCLCGVDDKTSFERCRPSSLLSSTKARSQQETSNTKLMEVWHGWLKGDRDMVTLKLRGGASHRASRGSLGAAMRALRRERAKTQKYFDDQKSKRNKLVDEESRLSKIESIDSRMQSRMAAEAEKEAGGDDGSPAPPPAAWPHVEGGQITEVDEIDRSQDGTVLEIPILRSKDKPITREEVIQTIPFSPIAPKEEQIERAMIPRLQWGDTVPTPESAVRLLHSLPQWIGERKSKLVDRMIAEAEERGAIDVEKRTAQLFSKLLSDVAAEGGGGGGGGEETLPLPQVENLRKMCEMRARREDEEGRQKAVAEAEEVARQEVDEPKGSPPPEQEYAWWGDVRREEMAKAHAEDHAEADHEAEIGEEGRDRFGKVLPEGYEKWSPILLNEDTFDEQPQLLEQAERGELEMCDGEEIHSYNRMLEDRRAEQECAELVVGYLTKMAQVYEEEGAIMLAEECWDMVHQVRRESGLDVKSAEELEIEKDHQSYQDETFNVMKQAREMEKQEDREREREWNEAIADEHGVHVDIGDVDIGWTPTAQNNVPALPNAAEKLRLKGREEAQDTLLEGSDGELREWFGDPEKVEFTPNVERTREGGLYLKDIGYGSDFFPQWPGFKEAVRRVHRSRDEQHRFVWRNVHEPRGERHAALCQGRLMVWGGNFCGQLAISQNEVDQPSPVSCPPFHDDTKLNGRIVSIAAGTFHTFITVANPSQLLACGWNRFGQLGLGARPLGEDAYPPELNPDAPTEEEAQTCREMLGDGWQELLREAKETVGTLGLDNRNVDQPLEVVDGLQGKRVLDAACGMTHSVLLVEVDEGAQGHVSTNAALQSPRSPTAAAAAPQGRTQVLACGMNDGGQLGQGHQSKIPSRSFQVVPALEGEKVVQVQCGWDFSLALLDSGVVLSWGWGAYGQLGQGGAADGTPLVSAEPRAMVGLGGRMDEEWKAREVVCGDTHIMVVLEGGGLLACGLNEHGQLGLGDYDNRAVPTEVPFFRACDQIAQVACGGDHTMLLLEDGTLFGFGKCWDGQIGTFVRLNTDKIAWALPQLCRVIDASGQQQPVRQVVCGTDHTLLVAASGQAFVMGSSKNGQTGLGNHGNALVAIEVPGVAGRNMRVAAGGYQSFAWGCAVDLRNKRWRLGSVLEPEWQMRERLMEDVEKEFNGTGPPLPLWGMEFLGAPEYPIPMAKHNPVGDSAYTEYDVRAAKSNELGRYELLGENRGEREENLLTPEDLTWGALRHASFVERVRWRHGLVHDPALVNASVLHGADDEFPSESASYPDDLTRAHARNLVTDYINEPMAVGPWYMKEILDGHEVVPKEVCSDSDW